MKTTVFLASLDDFQGMNAVYAEYFKDEPPARTTIECKMADAAVLVEIDCVAAISS